MKVREKVALLSAAALPLAACMGPDHDNYFVLEGTVVVADHNFVRVSDMEIIEAYGDAVELLADQGVEDVHDNYFEGKCYQYETTDDLDTLLDSGQLQNGTEVKITGSFGQSGYKCTPGSTMMHIHTRALLGSLSLLDES